ncbi:MAG: hypothetical protein FGM15_10845 [Chthoniobacterales bacterium]|nr:hypothetical protein [Chthoniobacterales bacterium]
METLFNPAWLRYWPVAAFYAVAIAAGLAFALFRRRRAESGAPAVPRAQIAGWVAISVLPPLVYLAALSWKFDTQAALFCAIMSATVLAWMFTLADEYVPVLLAVVATVFSGLAPARVALGGFSSPTLLMLLGVFALSAVVTSSALSTRLMLWSLLKLPDRPFWRQLVLLAGGYLLSPVMPSANARIALLVPVFRDMADIMRLPARGLAVTALFAATFAGGTLFAPMMATSRGANIAAIGFLPAQMQPEFLGIFWLVAAAVAAIVVTAAHFAAMARVFPRGEAERLCADDLRQRLSALGPMKAAEWMAAFLFTFFLCGCLTVSWHHVPPSVLGGCVLIALLFSGLLTRQEFRKNIDWPMIVFLLGVDSILRIMNHLGIGESLGAASAGLFAFVGGNIGLFIVAALATTLALRFVLTVTPCMLTSAIILMPVAMSGGIHPWIAIFLAAMFSDIWFVRYQGTTGYLQMCSLGLDRRIDEAAFLRYNMWLNAGRLAAAFASIPWWKWLGFL